MSDRSRPPGQDWSSHARHLDEIRSRYDAALAALGYDAVIIGAGNEVRAFGDDQSYPFRASPWFVQWAPLTRHPGSCLVYRPGHRPRLLLPAGGDYWHQPAAIPAGAWRKGFEWTRYASPAGLRRHLPRRRTALLAPPDQLVELAGSGAAVNPPALLTRLAWERATKTAWEVERIRAATALALAGHAAAAAAFSAGASEYEISHAFLAGSGQSDADLPYPTIVALNANGATLHYQHRQHTRLPRAARHSLLIDAGCASEGYACDITRTHAARRGPFATMIRDMDQAQQRLCAQIAPGRNFAQLQLAAHAAIAQLLHAWDLVRLPPEAIVQERISDLFFPHGLGHYLGLQVHDVGANLEDESGRSGRAPRRFPRLRLTRTLAAGQVLTVEPGVYFIDSLLGRLRRHRRARRVNWPAIRELRQYGGIRIEDDVLVTDCGMVNLTRG